MSHYWWSIPPFFILKMAVILHSNDHCNISVFFHFHCTVYSPSLPWGCSEVVGLVGEVKVSICQKKKEKREISNCQVFLPLHTYLYIRHRYSYLGASARCWWATVALVRRLPYLVLSVQPHLQQNGPESWRNGSAGSIWGAGPACSHKNQHLQTQIKVNSW